MEGLLNFLCFSFFFSFFYEGVCAVDQKNGINIYAFLFGIQAMYLCMFKKLRIPSYPPLPCPGNQMWSIKSVQRKKKKKPRQTFACRPSKKEIHLFFCNLND